MKKIIVFLIFLFVFAAQSKGQVIITFAGGGSGGDGGPATAAEMMTPSGVAIDKFGNVIITDQNNSRVRKVDRAGIITTIAGTGTTGYSGDGGPGTAALINWPTGAAVDTAGNIYIADQFNNVIRKVSAATGIITTIAGINTTGFSGDGGPATAAKLWHPADVGVDYAGNVYIVDQDNNAIRKVTVATGIINTVAGNDTFGFRGDGGPATAAELNFPQGITVDSTGNLSIADFYNNRIRYVDAATGIITTLAGNGTAGFSGDGGAATNAEIYNASALAVDAKGNIYISDYFNNLIRKVNATTGIITTIAGDLTLGYCCDCNPATTAEISQPSGVAVDSAGNVYIADYGNARVREVTTHFVCPALAIAADEAETSMIIVPNPSRGAFHIEIKNAPVGGSLNICDLMGRQLYETYMLRSRNEIDLPYLPPGIYFAHLISEKNNIIRKIVID